ncbi:hypothetical protein BH09BAC1_BH09BAC1_30590 [soil metagenome]
MNLVKKDVLYKYHVYLLRRVELLLENSLKVLQFLLLFIQLMCQQINRLSTQTKLVFIPVAT